MKKASQNDNAHYVLMVQCYSIPYIFVAIGIESKSSSKEAYWGLHLTTILAPDFQSMQQVSPRFFIESSGGITINHHQLSVILRSLLKHIRGHESLLNTMCGR